MKVSEDIKNVPTRISRLEGNEWMVETDIKVHIKPQSFVDKLKIIWLVLTDKLHYSSTVSTVLEVTASTAPAKVVQNFYFS